MTIRTTTAGRSPRSLNLPAGAMAYLALVAATLFWSGNFVAGRALRDDIDPVTLNMLRWAIALAILLPFFARDMWERRAAMARNIRWLLLLGATGIAGFHTMTYFALQTTTALNALLIVSLSPALVVAVSSVTGGMRPTRVQWAGCLASVAGVTVVLTKGDPGTLAALAFGRGDLWMLAAMIVWTAYTLLLRRRPEGMPQGAALTGSTIMGLLILVPASLLHPGTHVALAGPGWTALLYIAVFASVIAFLLWTYGIGEIGPERAGQFINLMPVFGAALGVIVLGEQISPFQAAGAALVIAGIALVNRMGVRKG